MDKYAAMRMKQQLGASVSSIKQSISSPPPVKPPVPVPTPTPPVEPPPSVSSPGTKPPMPVPPKPPELPAEPVKPPKPPPDIPTVVKNGVTYGVGKPLPGMWQYVQDGILRAGVYNPLDMGDISHPSQELNALVQKLMKEGGITYQEAVDLVQFYTNKQDTGGDPFTGSAVLNKNIKLYETLRDNLPGAAWRDIRNGVPVVAIDEKGNHTTMLLSPAKAAEIAKMTPEERFKALKELGIYPGDYSWVKWVGPDGKMTGTMLTGQEVKLHQIQGKADTLLRKAGAFDAEERLNLVSAIISGVADDYITAWLGDTPATKKLLSEAHKVVDAFTQSHVNIGGGWYSTTEIDNLRERSPYLYEILKKDGFAAYEKASKYSAIEGLIASPYFRDTETRPSNEYETAAILLSRFRNDDGSYNVTKALKYGMNAGGNVQTKIIAAVELLFAEEDLQEIRNKWRGLLDPAWAKLTSKAEREAVLYPDKADDVDLPISSKVVVIVRREGETQSEYDARKRAEWPELFAPEILTVSYKEALASVPAVLITASGAVKGSPVPHDDFAALIAIASVVGIGTAVNIVKKFFADNDRPVNIRDLYAINDKNIMPIKLEEKLHEKGGLQVDEIPKPITYQEGIKLVPMPKEIYKEGVPLTPDKLKDHIEEFPLQHWGNVLLYWPTPLTEEKAEDYFFATQAVADAATKVTAAKPTTLTIPFDPNKILQEAKVWGEIDRAVKLEAQYHRKTDSRVIKRLVGKHERFLARLPNTAKVRERALRIFNKKLQQEMTSAKNALAIGRASGKQNKAMQERFRLLATFSTAYQEYMTKYKIWQKAWDEYVNTFNMKPLKGGDISPDAKQALAAMQLTRLGEEIAKPSFKHFNELKDLTEIQQQALENLKDKVIEQYKVELQQMVSTQPITITDAQLKALMKPALNDATKTYLDTLTQTKSLTAAQVDTLTQTLTDTLTQTKPATATAATTAATTAQATQTAEKVIEKEIKKNIATTSPAELTRTQKRRRIPPPPPGSDDTDETKRAYLKDVPGLIARRRGALGGKQRQTFKIVVNDIPYYTTKHPNPLKHPVKVSAEKPVDSFDTGWRHFMKANERRENIEISFSGEKKEIVEGLKAVAKATALPLVAQKAQDDINYFTQKDAIDMTKKYWYRQYHPPKGTATDDDKREYLTKLPQARAINNGKRVDGVDKGKDVWIVNYWPYGEDDRMVLLGKPPAGAKVVRGKGSLQKTVALLRGKPPDKPISGGDTGAVDDVITFDGSKIKITSIPDKGQVNKELRKVKIRKIKEPKTGTIKLKTIDAGGGVEINKQGQGHIKL